MTPEQFKNNWTKIEDNFSSIREDRLSGFGLIQSTIDLLTISGLPKDAAPYLSFCNDSDDLYDGINKLTTQYDFLEPEFDKYIVIGSCNDGDPIAINTEKNDQVECLDHEDYFTPQLFNSSIYSLVNCLIAYRDFIITIQNENGEDAYINSDFTNEQFEKLKLEITQADNRVLTEKGFWYQQLEMELEMRADNQSNK